MHGAIQYLGLGFVTACRTLSVFRMFRQEVQFIETAVPPGFSLMKGAPS